MLVRKKIIYSALVACSVVALIACSNKNSEQPAPWRDKTGAASGSTSGMATSAKTSTSLELKVLEWGPDSTKAGIAFNVQPNGSSAMWIRANQSLDGGVAAIDFNGNALTSSSVGSLITATVPTQLYAKPGVYPVRIVMKIGANVIRSNDVEFHVK